MLELNHYIITISLCLIVAFGAKAQDVEQIFTKATQNLISEDLEMDLEMNTTDSKGRVKEKGFNVLMAKFGEVKKMKVSWQKPERAKGTTIIISTPPNEIGVIEVYTPSNGKVRKLKATEENMKLVGSEFSITNMSISDPEKMSFTYIKEANYNGNTCHVIEAKAKNIKDLSKGELWIEKDSYHIVQIRVFDEKGNNITLVELSDFKTVQGTTNKFQPMHMVSKDLSKNKTTDIKVLKASTRPNLSEADFTLPVEGSL